MGIFVKKTLTGGFREVPRDESTHYIQDTSEYLQTQQKLQSLNVKLVETTEKAEKQVEYYRNRAYKDVEDVRHKYEKQIQELQEKIESMEAAAGTDSERLKDLEWMYANLLRITRERANASRGISPKKRHDGYVITAYRQHRDYQELSSTGDYYQTYRSNNRFHKTEKVSIISWKFSVQTPYPIIIPIEQIDNQILAELESGLLEETGCEEIQKQNGPYLLHPDDKCILYRWDYAADFRSGLWTVDLYLSGLPDIPLSRIVKRPAPNTKGRNS